MVVAVVLGFVVVVVVVVVVVGNVLESGMQRGVCVCVCVCERDELMLCHGGGGALQRETKTSRD